MCGQRYPSPVIQAPRSSTRWCAAAAVNNASRPVVSPLASARERGCTAMAILACDSWYPTLARGTRRLAADLRVIGDDWPECEIMTDKAVRPIVYRAALSANCCRDQPHSQTILEALERHAVEREQWRMLVVRIVIAYRCEIQIIKSGGAIGHRAREGGDTAGNSHLVPDVPSGQRVSEAPTSGSTQPRRIEASVRVSGASMPSDV